MTKSRMPLLESIAGKYETAGDTVILHINHCMENSFYFNRQLKEIFHDVIFVAVPYNNKAVPAAENYTSYYAQKLNGEYFFKRNGKDLGSRSCDFIHAVYSLIFSAFENELLQYAKQDKQIIVIEDGGYHYHIMREITEMYPIFRTCITGAVEQTTAGTRNSVRQNGMGYPVLSVARSLYKTQIESYYVAGRIIHELKRMMHEIDEFIDFHSVLLLGYGIIGRSAAMRLKAENTYIYAYDINKNICREVSREGFCIWEKPYIFCENMIVIGAAGVPSFTSEMLDSFLKGGTKRIYLASASSKQVEFSEIFSELEDCEKKVIGSAAFYTFPGGKEIILFANGYPLNFYDKDVDSLTFGMIDPVFSEILMLAHFLKENYKMLRGRTLLLGDEPKLDAFVSEKELIGRWLKLNGLNFKAEDFNLHPLAEELKGISYEEVI